VFITVPIFAPVVVSLGFDPIWFGVLFVMNMQIYFLSPPFGPAAFWLKSVAPEDVTLQEIFMGVLPFIGLQVIGMFLVLFFPDIAMWLPNLISGN
jgi:TRAP-type mannitol/chloroaromatic compound transport system permease large subunit